MEPIAPPFHLLGRLGGKARDQLDERRQARSMYQELRRELAGYQTPADVADMLALLGREGESAQIEQMRVILEDNLSGYRRRQRRAA